MKLTPRLIRNLRQILQGESIPYSNLPKSLADPLVAEGLLNVIYHGSRRSLRTHNADALAGVLPRYNEREFGITKALTAVLKRDIDYQVTRSGRLIFYRRVYRQKTSCPLDSGTS